jgi:hypothetical protein
MKRLPHSPLREWGKNLSIDFNKLKRKNIKVLSTLQRDE